MSNIQKVVQYFAALERDASASTSTIASSLGIRNDKAANLLSSMRRYGLLYTKTSECCAAGVAIWHATDYLYSTLHKPNDVQVRTYIAEVQHSSGSGSKEFLFKGTLDQFKEYAKGLARTHTHRVYLKESLGSVIYIPPVIQDEFKWSE